MSSSYGGGREKVFVRVMILVQLGMDGEVGGAAWS